MSLLLTICVIAGNLDAEAGVNWRKYQYFQNWAGLNDQQSTTEIQDNEATDLSNVVFDLGGAIKKRFGYITLPSETPRRVSTGTVVEVTGVSYYRQDDGDRFLVGVANRDGNATVFKKNYTSTAGLVTGAYDIIDGVVNIGSYTNNNLCDFAVAENNIVFTVGTQTAPFMWTGSGHALRLTTDTDVPNATILEYHKNHLFLSGNTSNPSRVWFSNLDDMTNYTVTDFIDIQTSDGSQVRALISAYDALYIFKDNSIWRLSGWERDTFRLEKMVDGIGTLSNQSVVATNSGIYFTSRQCDVFHYDGSYTTTAISRKITTTVNGLNRNEVQRSLGLAFSTYKFQDVDYYAAMVTGTANTENDTVLLFDTNYKAWTKFDGLNPLSWTVGDNSTGGKTMYFGDYSGYIHQYPSASYYDGNVATSAIASFYQTKWFRYPEASLGDKHWRLLKTYALSVDDVFLHAECKSDYEASGKVVDINLESSQANWDVAVWDVDLWGGESVIVGRSEIEKGDNMFQVRYYNNNVNQGFTLLGFELFIEPHERV